MLYPHELFASLYRHYNQAFMARIAGSKKKIKSFWESVSDTVQYMNHPIKNVANHKSRAIPIFLHGDGVPCSGIGKSWSKMFDVWSWGSLLMEDGATWKTNFLILGIHTLLYSSDPLTSTDDDVFTIMCWSLLALYNGRYPPKHWDGSDWIEGSEDYNRRNQPLAGRFCCVLWSIFGCLDHFIKD